jgi:hypothetical protein
LITGTRGRDAKRARIHRGIFFPDRQIRQVSSSLFKQIPGVNFTEEIKRQTRKSSEPPRLIPAASAGARPKARNLRWQSSDDAILAGFIEIGGAIRVAK